MKKILSAIASLSAAFLLITAAGTPAFAGTEGPAYRLVPATAITSAKSVIVNETLWRCGTNGCVAAQAGSRPGIICAQAARRVGKIESFTANGTPFSADELAKCNEKARS